MTRSHTIRPREKFLLMLVTDVGPMRSPMVEFLERNGYDVETAATADDAMLLAQLVRWDGIIIDADPPRLNGVELYARILQYSGNKRLPVIFLATQPCLSLQWGLRDAPWARLVQKPCGPGTLLEALQKCLRGVGRATPAGGD